MNSECDAASARATGSARAPAEPQPFTPPLAGAGKRSVPGATGMPDELCAGSTKCDLQVWRLSHVDVCPSRRNRTNSERVGRDSITEAPCGRAGVGHWPSSALGAVAPDGGELPKRPKGAGVVSIRYRELEPLKGFTRVPVKHHAPLLSPDHAVTPRRVIAADGRFRGEAPWTVRAYRATICAGTACSETVSDCQRRVQRAATRRRATGPSAGPPVQAADLPSRRDACPRSIARTGSLGIRADVWRSGPARLPDRLPASVGWAVRGLSPHGRVWADRSFGVNRGTLRTGRANRKWCWSRTPAIRRRRSSTGWAPEPTGPTSSARCGSTPPIR